ncbi:hypothetical protein D3C87_1936310 [compost metagenome]
MIRKPVGMQTARLEAGDRADRGRLLQPVDKVVDTAIDKVGARSSEAVETCRKVCGYFG